jgi:hypothetical protein
MPHGPQAEFLRGVGDTAAGRSLAKRALKVDGCACIPPAACRASSHPRAASSTTTARRGSALRRWRARRASTALTTARPPRSTRSPRWARCSRCARVPACAFSALMHAIALRSITPVYLSQVPLSQAPPLAQIAAELKEDVAVVTAAEALELVGGVGLCFRGPCGDFPDPWAYRVHEVYLDCTLNQSDLWTAFKQGRGAELVSEPGALWPDGWSLTGPRGSSAPPAPTSPSRAWTPCAHPRQRPSTRTRRPRRLSTRCTPR